MTQLQMPADFIMEFGTDNALLLAVLNYIAKNTKPTINGYFPFSRQNDIQPILYDWKHKRIRNALKALAELEMIEYEQKGKHIKKSTFKFTQKFKNLQQQKKQKQRNKKEKKKSNIKEIKEINKEKTKKEQKNLEEKKKKLRKKEKAEQIDGSLLVKTPIKKIGFFTDVPDTNTKNYSKANFERLWKEWPGKTKGSKGDALKMFERVAKQKDSPQFEDLLQSIKNQSQSEQWQAGFIPHVRTWLSKKRWIDETEHLKTFQLINAATDQSNEFLPQATQAMNNCIDKPIVDTPQCAGRLCNLMKTWQERQMTWRIRLDGTEIAQMKALGLPKIQYKDYLRKCAYLPDHLEMMESYLRFLNEAEYVSKIRPTLFNADNQIMFNWIDEMQEDLGHDLMTGKTI